MKPSEKSLSKSALYWCRVYPKNPQSGFFVERYSVSNTELGVEPEDESTLFYGGDGISAIPMWYAVSEEQARVLAEKRQPVTVAGQSFPVFQIVTDEVRRQIDTYENTARVRMAAVGTDGITSVTDPRVRNVVSGIESHDLVQRTLHA